MSDKVLSVSMIIKKNSTNKKALVKIISYKEHIVWP